MSPSLKKTSRGPLSKKIASAPIMRGNLGLGSDEWNVVGSGRKVRKMNQWVKSELPHNWQQLLGVQFVDYISNTNFIFYHCPICNVDI